MKKLLFVLIAVILVLPGKAQSNNQNVVTLSLTNLFLLTPTVYYERVLSEKTSVQLGLSYTMFKVEESKMSGLGIIPEFRYYPGAKGAPQGFYLAPFLKYTRYAITAESSVQGSTASAEMSLSGIGGGACIGIQVGKTVVFDVFLGPSIMNWNAKYEGNSSADDFTLKVGDSSGGTTVGLRFGMSLGFSF